MHFILTLLINIKIMLWTYQIIDCFLSCIGLVKEKAIKLEPPLPATGSKENISVPDTYRCRTPENQIEKDRISCKGKTWNESCFLKKNRMLMTKNCFEKCSITNSFVNKNLNGNLGNLSFYAFVPVWISLEITLYVVCHCYKRDWNKL